jgi:hypothetical protein
MFGTKAWVPKERVEYQIRSTTFAIQKEWEVESGKFWKTESQLLTPHHWFRKRFLKSTRTGADRTLRSKQWV